MLLSRLIRAATFNGELYDEVKGDSALTVEAALVVLLASVSGGLASMISFLIDGAKFGDAILMLVRAVIFQVIGWALLAFLVYFIGATFFGGKVSFNELLRTTGYAYAPGVAAVVCFIWGLRPFLWVVFLLWVIGTVIYAIIRSFGGTPGNALMTWLISAVALVGLASLIGLIFNTYWLTAQAFLYWPWIFH
jgi:hypothetical protein